MDDKHEELEGDSITAISFTRAVKANARQHGTRCAGQIVGSPGGQCGVGVAPQVHLVSVRLLGGLMTARMEADAIAYSARHADIVNCSWGPLDDGKTLEGPHSSVIEAFLEGLANGRNGLGALFVMASGNGGRLGDDCNADGYAAAPWAISIGAITHDHQVPPYQEHCAPMLAVAHGSGSGRSIWTTNTLRKNSSNKIQIDSFGGEDDSVCTEGHGGTSAAAPLVSAALALGMEARPELTWHDWHHILVRSVRSVGTGDDGKFSPWHGFGILDVERMVQVALNWTPVGNPRIMRSAPSKSNLIYLDSLHGLLVDRAMVRLSLDYKGKRGDLEVFLTSPSGRRSQLLTKRPLDTSTEGFRQWPMSISAFWDEPSGGQWIIDFNNKDVDFEWQLIIFGTDTQNTEPYSEAMRQWHKDARQVYNFNWI